jgi:hypothetical protein
VTDGELEANHGINCDVILALLMGGVPLSQEPGPEANEGRCAHCGVALRTRRQTYCAVCYETYKPKQKRDRRAERERAAARVGGTG